MAEQVGNFLISNNSSSKRQRASLTVKRLDGVILARVHSDRDRILQRIRRYAVLEERQELESKLRLAGVSMEDIAAIVAPVSNVKKF